MFGFLTYSSCHAAMSDDALDTCKMNVNPGGKEHKMRDSEWQGKVQKMFQSLCTEGNATGFTGKGDRYESYGWRGDENNTGQYG